MTEYMQVISREIEKYCIQYEEIEKKIIFTKFNKSQECSIISCRNMAFEFWKIISKEELPVLAGGR